MPFAQGPPHQQVAPSQQVVTSSGPDSPIGPPSSDTFVCLVGFTVDTLILIF